jgi:MFS family permease
MKPTQFLFYLLLVICALNTTHNAVYNQCILFINQDLHGSDLQLKLSISLYFCAIFFIRCIVGLVSDRYSVKKCLFITLLIALFGHCLACCATNMPMFVVARFIQGLGLGGGQVIGLVLLMQVFAQKSRASIVASEQVFFAMASALLPLMGHGFSASISWRLTYVAYFAATVFALLYFLFFQHADTIASISSPDEALTDESQAASKHLIWNRKFLVPCLMAGLTMSSFCLWCSYFSLIVRHYGIDLHYLLVYQLLPIVPIFLLSIAFNKVVASMPKSALCRGVLWCQIATLASIGLLCAWNKTSSSFKFALLCPILLHSATNAFFRPLVQARALNGVPNNRIGMASSFISICQVGINAFFSIIINCVHAFLPTFCAIQVFIIGCICWYSLRHVSRQSLAA